ncbi:MAG: alpha/beta hydrolase [Acidobacteria bacterium]|nr:alpha/beta hydrolase [Acidobacteriota bacterium]
MKFLISAKRASPILLLTFIFLSSLNLDAQTSPVLLEIADRYWMQPDVAYNKAGGVVTKLDVWYPRDNDKPTPTVVYIHGGGWIFGQKEGAVYQFLPYLEKGWRVVNVEYRMVSDAYAPGAVEDTRCALRWIYRNAAQYKFDTSKIVLTGHSAGGHLSLITAMLPFNSKFDNRCFADAAFGEPEMKPAAVVNWYGITDVNDLLEGSNQKNYAVMWFGSLRDRDELAKELSPLTYVNKNNSPVITIHGDKDSVVPYSHGVRLKEALDKEGVKNKLHTVKGGDHGMFTKQQYVDAFEEIWPFLEANGIK